MIKITKRKGTSKKDLTREKILNAALECFAEKGYKETTVDEIAKRANVSKGNIYWHFKSKLEIFREVIKEEAKKIHKIIEEEENDSLPLNELWKRKTEKAFAIVKKLEKQFKVFYEVAFRAWKAEESKNFFFEIEKENMDKHTKILQRELQARNLKLSKDDIEKIAKLQTLFHQAIAFRILIFQEDNESWKELKELIFLFIDILSFYIVKRGEKVEEGTA
ncbi:MAG: TetR/AcrR family transcriptional regulator [Synergistetes bacterium]|nr:TetR/AcrR family transcriptional regulator [Synergistota bacterium]MDK2870848.1 hypothetical protein [bacterium]